MLSPPACPLRTSSGTVAGLGTVPEGFDSVVELHDSRRALTGDA